MFNFHCNTQSFCVFSYHENVIDIKKLAVAVSVVVRGKRFSLPPACLASMLRLNPKVGNIEVQTTRQDIFSATIYILVALYTLPAVMFRIQDWRALPKKEE